MSAEGLQSIACPKCGGQKFVEQPSDKSATPSPQYVGVNLATPEPLRLVCEYCGHHFIYEPKSAINLAGQVIGGDNFSVTNITHNTPAKPAPSPRLEQCQYLLNTLKEKLADTTLTLPAGVKETLQTCMETIQTQLDAAQPDQKILRANLTQMGNELNQAKKWKLAGLVTSLEDQVDTLFR